MRCKWLMLIGLIVAGGVFWMWRTNVSPDGCRSTSRSPQGVTWHHDHVFTVSGDTLLSIKDFSDTFPVSPDARFGAPDRITGAVLSPDGNWIAVSVAGDVHGFGWLYDLSTDTRHPVAFQYGGAVRFDSWSPDGRFAAFVQESPAPIATIKLIDRRRIGGFVSTTGYVIHVEAEEKLNPPYTYRIDGWKAPHTMCFSLAGFQYCMDVETRTMVR